MNDAKLSARWVGAGRKAQCAPNQLYPTGIDVDGARGAAASCRTALPYPAPECGHWVVDCERCGCRVIVTAAGRPDDPRSVTVPCKTVP